MDGPLMRWLRKGLEILGSIRSGPRTDAKEISSPSAGISPAGPSTPGKPTARRATVRIVNKKGLHARASAKLVEAAARFQCRITVTKDGQTVDARSIMGLMMLAASMGCDVEIAAEGVDAEEAMVAIVALAEAKFGED
jgi:phosphocarrier protein HPr